MLVSRPRNTHLEPANIEKELQKGKDGKVKVKIVPLITQGGVEKLPTNQTSQKEAVHSHSNHLWKMPNLCQISCADFNGLFTLIYKQLMNM